MLRDTASLMPPKVTTFSPTLQLHALCCSRFSSSFQPHALSPHPDFTATRLSTPVRFPPALQPYFSAPLPLPSPYSYMPSAAPGSTSPFSPPPCLHYPSFTSTRPPPLTPPPSPLNRFMRSAAPCSNCPFILRALPQLPNFTSAGNRGR